METEHYAVEGWVFKGASNQGFARYSIDTECCKVAVFDEAGLQRTKKSWKGKVSGWSKKTGGDFGALMESIKGSLKGERRKGRGEKGNFGKIKVAARASGRANK
jgi:hypothetical protein